MRTVAFVFARGGSKGLPGKNIRKLGNMPLVAHSISVATQVNEIERVFVSTDSSEIANVAYEFGAEFIMRPSELAQDDSPEWLAWQHAIEETRNLVGEFDRFISLPATAPLRLAEDVVKCLDALDAQTDAVVTMTPAARSPWFNMVRSDSRGYVRVLCDGDTGLSRRQDAPQAFDLSTVAYVARPKFILANENIWSGRVRGVTIPQERAIDIDTEYDFRIAEYLMRERMKCDD